MVEVHITKKNGIKLKKRMSATVAEEVSSTSSCPEFFRIRGSSANSEEMAKPYRDGVHSISCLEVFLCRVELANRLLVAISGQMREELLKPLASLLYKALWKMRQ